jgi:hypothetical protein
VVAATLAGTRAWNKTAAEQRERDRKARMGTADTKDSALNIVSASEKIKTKDGDMDMGITAKLERLVAEYAKVPEDVASADRVRFFERLKARTSYSEDKLRLNRIQFGDKKNFAVNQAKFFETLAQAKILLVEEDQRKKLAKEKAKTSYVEFRLQRYMDYRESAINNRRHKEQAGRVVIASSLAGAASFAGILAAEEYRTGNVSSTVKEWLGWNGDELEEIEVSGTDTTEVKDPVRSVPSSAPAPEVRVEQVQEDATEVSEERVQEVPRDLAEEVVETASTTESAETSTVEIERIETPKSEPVVEVVADQDPPPEKSPRRGQPVPLVSDRELISLRNSGMQDEFLEEQLSALPEQLPGGDIPPSQMDAEIPSAPKPELASKFVSGLVSKQDWVRMRGVHVDDLFNRMPPQFVPGRSNPYWPIRNAVTALSNEFNIKPMYRESLDSFFRRALNQHGVTEERVAKLLEKAR